MSERQRQPDDIHWAWVVLIFIVVEVMSELALGTAFELGGFRYIENLEALRLLFSTLPTLLSAIIATTVTWFAFREPTGLLDPRPAVRFGNGFLIGAVLLTVVVLVPMLAGATTLRFNAAWPLRSGLLQLVTLAPAGIGEEMMLRGIGFNALRRGLGNVATVVITSVIFGALHLFNPHASWVGTLIIALVGVWFGIIVVRTGSVWTSIGLHVAWNFFEGFVFGQPVSGNETGPALFKGGVRSASMFWSGGDFGPEAAGFTALALFFAIAITLAWPRRNRGAPT